MSTGARLYVETGRADGLDTDGDSPNSLHSFTGPPIPQGEGTSVTRAFLDGNHTLISIMARINPSPDWFVGVDSFQLCVEGNWVDTVTVEVITFSINMKLNVSAIEISLEKRKLNGCDAEYCTMQCSCTFSKMPMLFLIVIQI